MTDAQTGRMRQEAPRAFLRVFVTLDGVQLISDDADCIEAALEVARTRDEVVDVGVAEQAGSDYAPPATPAPAGEKPSAGLFHYRLGLAPGIPAEGFAAALADVLRLTFEQGDRGCQVMLES